MSRRNDWCKHYRGLSNGDTCAAGVKYAGVQKAGDDGRKSLPCIPDWNYTGVTCEKCEFRTPEEVAAMEAEQAKRFDDLMNARKAIVEHLGGKWKKGTPGASGRILCPVCGMPDALAFSRAGYNGHIHARCATPKCVSWME